MAVSLDRSSRGEETISILSCSFGLKILVLRYAVKRQIKDTVSKVMLVAENG